MGGNCRERSDRYVQREREPNRSVQTHGVAFIRLFKIFRTELHYSVVADQMAETRRVANLSSDVAGFSREMRNSTVHPLGTTTTPLDNRVKSC